MHLFGHLLIQVQIGEGLAQTGPFLAEGWVLCEDVLFKVQLESASSSRDAGQCFHYVWDDFLAWPLFDPVYRWAPVCWTALPKSGFYSCVHLLINLLIHPIYAFFIPSSIRCSLSGFKVLTTYCSRLCGGTNRKIRIYLPICCGRQVWTHMNIV